MSGLPQDRLPFGFPSAPHWSASPLHAQPASPPATVPQPPEDFWDRVAAAVARILVERMP